MPASSAPASSAADNKQLVVVRAAGPIEIVAHVRNLTSLCRDDS
jgi:hypothetical protein